jgi:hypothetical protein
MSATGQAGSPTAVNASGGGARFTLELSVNAAPDE